jgi:flagellar protein FliL
MIKFVLPVLSLMVGLGGGGAAAIMLGPAASEQHGAGVDHSGTAEEDSATHDDGQDKGPTEIVKLPNQFVVPVIVNKSVRSMVILTVALEVEQGQADFVRTLEPKLRDTFLDELFNLAAMGGFRDELISRKTLEIVRAALSQRARDVLRQKAVTVLVTDMARQDVR